MRMKNTFIISLNDFRVVRVQSLHIADESSQEREKKKFDNEFLLTVTHNILGILKLHRLNPQNRQHAHPLVTICRTSVILMMR